MAVALRSYSVGQSATGGTITMTEPTGAAQDDILIAIVANGTGTNPTTNTGWTSLDNGIGTGHSSNGINIQYVVRGASTPSDMGFATNPGSNPATIIMLCISGADTTNTFNAHSLTFDTDNSTGTTDTPSLTTTADNCFIIRGGFTRRVTDGISFATTTVAAPVTSGSGNTGADLAVSTDTLATAGSVPAETLTITANLYLDTFAFAIKPAAAAGPDGTGGYDNGNGAGYHYHAYDNSADKTTHDYGTLANNGSFDIYEHHPTNTDGGTKVNHKVYVGGVLQNTAVVDQTANGGTFNQIFTGITASASDDVKVEIECTIPSGGTGTYVYDDAIKFVFTQNNLITAADPAFSTAGGTFTTPVTLTLTCSTDNSVIFYTTDGTTPDQTSNPYFTPLKLTTSQTIKAIAYIANDPPDGPSSVVSETYTINIAPQLARWDWYSSGYSGLNSTINTGQK